MWGSCCFNKGDVKVMEAFTLCIDLQHCKFVSKQVTLGTGSFLNVNTGQKCHASVHGLYPLVAWKWRNREQKSDELMYCVEVRNVRAKKIKKNFRPKIFCLILGCIQRHWFNNQMGSRFWYVVSHYKVLLINRNFIYFRIIYGSS